MRWFKDGDKNTKFFHNYVKGRRKRLRIHDIQTTQGDTVKSTKNIGAAAVEYFENHFREDSSTVNYDMLQVIPHMITSEQNNEMTMIPGCDEVKKVVFGLNKDSTSGSDGFSGHFFQDSWDIIKEDVTNMVRAFFSGQQLPRFITHTNLILIPKKENVKTFVDLRPISLSTFINKIISRLLHGRMAKCLPFIISRNQFGFVKGRNITENVLLAQEIIRDIKLRNKENNVVVKLDMAKAYDRVLWIFLTKVLRKFGFSERIVDMVWRLISNNWYSILVNGISHGFLGRQEG